MWTWLIRIGASAAPWAYGWISNDLYDWFDGSDPDVKQEDAFAVGGWGLSVVMISVIVWFSWDKWGKK